MIIIKKLRKAGRSYGRGMDNFYMPAVYGIFKNGKQVGFIHGSEQRYMGSVEWTINNINHRELKHFFKGGLKAAKAWAIRNM